jgi:hypothetical protein
MIKHYFLFTQFYIFKLCVYYFFMKTILAILNISNKNTIIIFSFE